MCYSPNEHVEDCKRAVKAAQLVAKHYPSARQEDRREGWAWASEDALRNATHFDIGVIERDGRKEPVFYPYHQIEDDGVAVRVYAAGWDGRMPGWDFVGRVSRQPDLHAAILALLKERR